MLDRGIVLVIVMMVATLLLISLAATLPSVYQEGQREREEELIFRGIQYGRAIALFHKQFNRYPVSTKELLQTNGIRFLRQEYRDPMDPKGKWRFIHVNAQGVLLDSINQPLTNGQNGNPAGIGSNNSTSPNNPTAGGGFSLGGSDSLGLQSGAGMNPAGGGSSPLGSTSSFAGGSSQTGSTSSLGDQSGIQGAYIAGVAATSHHESIKIWNKHHHYDEWEFLGIDMGLLGIQVGMPGAAAAPAGVTQQPSQGSGFSPGSFGSPPPSSNFGPSSN